MIPTRVWYYWMKTRVDAEEKKVSRGELETAPGEVSEVSPIVRLVSHVTLNLTKAGLTEALLLCQAKV